MVAGLLMMGGGKLPRSDESSLVGMLPGQVEALSWTSVRFWVAMVAAQGFSSAFFQRPSSWARAGPVWCTVPIEGDIPTGPINFEFFFNNKLCLVSSSRYYQFGGRDSELKTGFECGAAEIPAHAGRDPLPLPHFSARHPVIMGDVHWRWTKANIQVLMVVAISLNDRMICLVHYIPDGTPILNMISVYGYINLAWHQIFMEISEFYYGFIGYAARSKYFSWNNFSCVNLRSKVSMSVTSLEHYYVHAHQHSYNGSPVGPTEQSYLTCFCCTSLPLDDDTLVEDTVLVLFELCHRRWTTAPSLLILRFDSGDPLSLSSVKAIQYLQLNPYKPQVHTPDRPSVESTAGHQLVWSTNEALEDCNCSKFEPELSSDKRPLFDSSCSLRYLLCIAWSSRICYLQLSTDGSCSLQSFVILFRDR